MHYWLYIVRRFLAEYNIDICGTSRGYEITLCTIILYGSQRDIMNLVSKNINLYLQRRLQRPRNTHKYMFKTSVPPLALSDWSSVYNVTAILFLFDYEHDNEIPAVAQRCVMYCSHSMHTWRFINISLK